MFPEPIPFFAIPIYLFGIISGLSILLGYWVALREVDRLELPAEDLSDLAVWVVLSALLGARIFFILEHWPHYVSFPLLALRFWEGGLVFSGGIVGGLVGGFLFCRLRNISFSKWADPIALGVALGLAASRLACFAAGCCFGRPTTLPWGIAFRHPLSLAEPLHTPLHPTQLYAFAMGLAVFLILFFRRRKRSFEGELLLIFLALASGSRMVLEFFRPYHHSITLITSGLILVSSAVLYGQLRLKQGGILMNRSFARLSGLVLVGVFFAACGIIRTQQISRGLDISSSNVASIVKGTTTEKEIIKMFGPPTKVRDAAEGKEFFYEYTKSGGPQWNLLISVGGNTVTKTLLVWLDKNGVVTDYAFKKS